MKNILVYKAKFETPLSVEEITNNINAITFSKCENKDDSGAVFSGKAEDGSFWLILRPDVILVSYRMIMPIVTGKLVRNDEQTTCTLKISWPGLIVFFLSFMKLIIAVGTLAQQRYFQFACAMGGFLLLDVFAHAFFLKVCARCREILNIAACWNETHNEIKCSGVVNTRCYVTHFPLQLCLQYLSNSNVYDFYKYEWSKTEQCYHIVFKNETHKQLGDASYNIIFQEGINGTEIYLRRVGVCFDMEMISEVNVDEFWKRKLCAILKDNKS